MTEVESWATIIGALGLGTILQTLAKGLIGWAGGSQDRSRTRGANLITQRDDAYAHTKAAEARADEAEARADARVCTVDAKLERAIEARRQLAAYASALRRDCVEHGTPPEQLRTWPMSAPSDPPTAL